MPKTNASGASTGTRARPKPTARKPRAKKPADGQVRLTGDRLVVRIPGDGERTSAGGLLIPATAMPAPKRLQWGDVALVGPDVRVAANGDRVLFLPQAGLEVEFEGEDLLLLRERDVQAVRSPGAQPDRAPGQYL
jgi:chaperonin GroES